MSATLSPIASKRPRPLVGDIWDIRCHTSIMVGPYEFHSNGNVVHGQEGWQVVVDDELNCVWIGRHDRAAVGEAERATYWTRVGWDTIRYLRYRQAK